MNKEIKFRAKRLDNGEWVCGGYHHATGESVMLIDRSAPKPDDWVYKHVSLDHHLICQFTPPDRQGWDYDGQTRFFRVDPATVGQFIGNVCNLDLWQGDIVEIPNLKQNWRSEPKVNWRRFKLIYNRYVWAFENDFIYMPLREMDEDCSYTYEIKVIGNIHDNPELLEEVKP